MSSPKLAQQLDISRTSGRRGWRNDRGLRSYKKRIVPLMTDTEKSRKKEFANWLRTNLKKEDTLKILFSDEKIFDIDGVCNAHNNRMWPVDRDEKVGRKQKRTFSQKIMIWLGVCSKGVTPLVILGKGTTDTSANVLLVAIKYGNKVFADDWTYQQDNATSYAHNLTQEWCEQNFPSFIDKDHWPPNSLYLNPFDYSIWE